MNDPIAYVGIDYHINVLAIAVVVKEQKGFHETVRLSNNGKIIKRYMKKLSKQFKIKAYYNIWKAVLITLSNKSNKFLHRHSIPSA